MAWGLACEGFSGCGWVAAISRASFAALISLCPELLILLSLPAVWWVYQQTGVNFHEII
jgi:hypothetical protein